jgi:hypothetical protein
MENQATFTGKEISHSPTQLGPAGQATLNIWAQKMGTNSVLQSCFNLQFKYGTMDEAQIVTNSKREAQLCSLFLLYANCSPCAT